MIVKEFYTTRVDGVNLYRTYSTEGLQIRKVDTDEIYDDAIDVESAPYVYEETDMLIESDHEGDGVHITGDEFLAKVEAIL